MSLEHSQLEEIIELQDEVERLKAIEKICERYDARLAIKDEIIRRLDFKIAGLKSVPDRQNP